MSNGTLKKRIALKEPQVRRLTSFATLERKALQELAGQLDAAPHAFRPDDVRARVQTVVPDIQSAESIVGTLLYWASFARQNNFMTDELATALSEGMGRTDSTDEVKSYWSENIHYLTRLFSSLSIQQTAKSLDLLYDYPKHVIGSRIITELRPSFHNNDDEIDGFVLQQTLHIDYVDSRGRSTVSMAIDIEEIERMQRACKRAIRKNTTAKEIIAKKLGLPVLVSGEDHLNDA